MKYVFILLLSFLCENIFAQNQCPWPPAGGNQLSPQRTPIEHPGGGKDFAGETSVDPNEIIGPQGYDSLQWVSINDVLNYTIYFENDPEFATANAQRVDVRFDFGKKELMKDFTLGSYGFANMSWNIDNAANIYQNRLNLVDTMQIYVDLIAGLDVTKKQAFWKFSSIDPESGFAPWQHDRGMLPVNDSTHVGEGFVQFSLKPVSTMKTGDTISIAANIVFDQNDTIPTNRWKNVIDAGNPESKVMSTVDTENPRIHHLTFEAKDDEGGSGVKQIRLFLANQFGVYEEYAVCSADSTIDIDTEVGRKYEFYSLAEDNVGNREPLKERADVVLNNNLAPTDIQLSATSFQDDIAEGGFIAEVSSIDTEENGTFTYELAEGEGAIHNDFFLIEGSQLKAKNSFKCADVNEYKIRISTTDEGGLSFSKAFVLNMDNVLEKPKPDTLDVTVCHDESFLFRGVEYSESGTYLYSESNDYMCDSIFVINLIVLPHVDAPLVTVEGDYTLVSSAERNNQWFDSEGNPIADATEQKFTPTVDGIYYLAIKNGNCYSDLSKGYRVQVSDRIDLNMDLANGWNWISSNLSDDGYRKATDFIKPIEDKVERMVGFNSELVRDPNMGLVGNLDILDPTESYLLQTNESLENVWEGIAYKPETTSVSLKKGWNWIGYVPVSENTLAKSLSTLTPIEGDVIKGYDSFATYSGGKWVGTLETMTPGHGYMYYAGAESSFNYPAVRVFEINDGISYAKSFASYIDNAPWHIDSNKYPYNMTMIANVYSNGNVAPAGYYTVGAFAGNECRGIGQYIEDKLYMTIYGDVHNHEAITFKAFDNVTMAECSVSESKEFGNTMVGSASSPFHLTVNTTTGIMSVEQNTYNIYPNPVRSTLYVNGDINRIKSVSVIANSGATVAKTDQYTSNGLDVSGLIEGSYITVINTVDGIVVKKILKVN